MCQGHCVTLCVHSVHVYVFNIAGDIQKSTDRRHVPMLLCDDEESPCDSPTNPYIKYYSWSVNLPHRNVQGKYN